MPDRCRCHQKRCLKGPILPTFTIYFSLKVHSWRLHGLWIKTNHNSFLHFPSCLYPLELNRPFLLLHLPFILDVLFWSSCIEPHSESSLCWKARSLQCKWAKKINCFCRIFRYMQILTVWWFTNLCCIVAQSKVVPLSSSSHKLIS